MREHWYTRVGIALIIASCSHPDLRRGPNGNDPDGGMSFNDGGPIDPAPVTCDDRLADKIVDGSDPGNPKTSCTGGETCDPWAPGYRIDAAAQQAASLMVGSMSISERA